MCNPPAAMNLFKPAVLLGLMVALGAPCPAGTDMDTALARYREIVLAEPHCDEIQTLPIDVAQLLADLSPAGTWADLDYGFNHPADWPPATHLHRTRSIAHAFASPGHPLHGDPAALDGARRAFRHWLEEDYRCVNWWWNKIGAPGLARDVLVLLGSDAAEGQREAAIAVIARHHTGSSGANLVWGAELGFHHACLTGDVEKADAAVARILGEITTDRREGIKPDNSFYQHGERMHAFGYGRSFLDCAVNLAWQSRGTRWEMPLAKREILSAFILDGLQWMCRGTYTPPGTIDREISRIKAMGKADLRRLLPRWAEVDPVRRAETEAFLAHQRGASERPFGFRHFPFGELATYHRPAGSIFVKTLSARTKGTESTNRENLKGRPYLHHGDHYIVGDGQEYRGLAPVWNWSRLPGLTMAGEGSTLAQRPFAGGVGDGRSGMLTMEYRRTREGDETALAVRKSWFFHGDLMVCLLGGWSVPEGQTASTSLEQCRLRGAVEVPAAADKSWTLHNGVGYSALGGASLDVSWDEAAGSWSSINERYHDEKDSVREPVLNIALPGEAEGFAVLLGADAEELAALHAAPPWAVLRNDSTVQAIRFEGGPTMATFAGPAGAGGVEVSAPCVAFWDSDQLLVADPTHRGGEVTATWRGATTELQLPDDGSAARIAPPAPDTPTPTVRGACNSNR